MKKINIAVIGPIGVGKTTLLDYLKKYFSNSIDKVIVKSEPSVTVPFVNDVLKKFYDDNVNWCLPLQLLISAVQETYFQELREEDYDYALVDMPFSSEPYMYSNFKNGRTNLQNYSAFLNICSKFAFDYVILINENKETTIKRLKSRNKRVEEGDMDPDRKDVSIDDFSYMDKHIADFKEYQEIWLNHFKADNPNIKIIRLDNIPDLNDDSDAYNNLILKIVNGIRYDQIEFNYSIY